MVIGLTVFTVCLLVGGDTWSVGYASNWADAELYQSWEAGAADPPMSSHMAVHLTIHVCLNFTCSCVSGRVPSVA
jgi:hypothetical protein